jgi:phosphoglucosamine mutase
MAVYLANENKLSNSSCVATVMSNKALEDYLNQHNIELLRSDVGDKNVLQIMKDKDINFGGEQSGHVIMHDFAKTGDGLVSALQVLALIIYSKKRASEVLRPFDLYPQKLVNLHVKEKKPLEQIGGLDAKLKDLDDKNIRHLIRYSGTENKLRVLLESQDAKEMNKEMDSLIEFFKKALNE